MAIIILSLVSCDYPFLGSHTKFIIDHVNASEQPSDKVNLCSASIFVQCLQDRNTLIEQSHTQTLLIINNHRLPASVLLGNQAI